MTSDAKHVEIGLTDKSDSARWILADLWRRGIAPSQVLIAGDEFGPLGGLTGSDSYLLVPEAIRATVVTVGVEPTGVPSGIVAAPGGPATFFTLLADQRDRRRRGDVSDVDEDPAWAIDVDGFDTRLERVHESLLTLADGRLGTRGAPLTGNGATTADVLYAGVYDGEGPTAELARNPHWARLPSGADRHPRRRTLDLHTGLLRENGDVGSLRFSSLDRPGRSRCGRRVILRSFHPADADVLAVVSPPSSVTDADVESSSGSAPTTPRSRSRARLSRKPRTRASSGCSTSIARRGGGGGTRPTWSSTATKRSSGPFDSGSST